MTELLAPAGTMEALRAAIANGCDAVYLGMQQFGARAYSCNFDEETLPEADFFVLVCGGKWWETARTLAASRYFLSRGRCILLFNHMSEDLRMKLPDDLKGVPCFYLPFFANPLKEDRDAAACFREIMTTGTGGMKTWERKKRRRGFWTRRPGS